jgi:hypothetical protein
MKIHNDYRKYISSAPGYTLCIVSRGMTYQSIKWCMCPMAQSLRGSEFVEWGQNKGKEGVKQQKNWINPNFSAKSKDLFLNKYGLEINCCHNGRTTLKPFLIVSSDCRSNIVVNTCKIEVANSNSIIFEWALSLNLLYEFRTNTIGGSRISDENTIDCIRDISYYNCT